MLLKTGASNETKITCLNIPMGNTYTVQTWQILAQGSAVTPS